MDTPAHKPKVISNPFVTPQSLPKPEFDDDVIVLPSKNLLTTLTKPKRKPRLKRPDATIIADLSNPSSEAKYLIHYALNYSKKLVCVAGAGISTSSGIPDFRSSSGLFQSSGKEMFDYNHVYSSNEKRDTFHGMIATLYDKCLDTEPTPFHKLLNDISQDGRLLRMYTQNIDFLETKLPNLKTSLPLTKPYPVLIQLHGTLDTMVCTKCRHNYPMNPAQLGHKCPECEEMESVRAMVGRRSQGCGSLRPRVVLYNEFHPDGERIGEITSLDYKKKPDCLVIAGTTLKIPGVRSVCKHFSQIVKQNKGLVIWINTEAPPSHITDFLHVDVVVIGTCDEVASLVKQYGLQKK